MKKYVCKRGHQRTPDNLTDNGTCKICMREKARELRKLKPKKLPSLFCKRGHARIPENTKEGGACKLCACISSKRWQQENVERVKEIERKSIQKHRKERIARTIRWNKANREKVRKNAQLFYSRHTADSLARSTEYKHLKIKRVLNWLSKDQRKKITEFYKLAKEAERLTGIKFHVDHIVPLRGKNVSGLHVPWNLQLLTAEDNMAKRNLFGITP